MNKDVIYIEPEDDITDIITKIENSKEKIIALVPPKKASVFRSIVNIKLIAKAGLNAEKTVVLVTTDPSIMKLAGVTKLPVTKDLQSAPMIPEDSATSEIETTSEEAVLEAAGGETAEEVVETVEDEAEPDKTEMKIPNTEKEEEKEPEKEEEKKEEKEEEKKDGEKPKRFSKEWFIKYKKLLIICGSCGFVFILFLIWAFGIAPAADVTVAVRTTTTNFSENATFTHLLSEENVAEGKFYLTEEKTENKNEIEFEATGKKNIGEKATGNLVIFAYFSTKGTVAIEKDSTYFTISNGSVDGLKYVATESVQLSWNGKFDSCENDESPCLISGRVPVVAAEPGDAYNIPASKSGWKSSNGNVWVYSDSAMSGGSDKTVTIVQQSDVEEALAKIIEENNKTKEARIEKLAATIGDGMFKIDSSYQQKLDEPVSTPKVGEEVEEGKKAKLSVTAIDTIYAIDKTKVEEFISEKSKLTDSYKIYKMNDPFIENFTEVSDGYVGKIKTSFVSGPKVTENDIINIIKGKGLGEARANLLDSFNGIDSNKTRINVSYPWVFSVPSNPTKITVTIEVEE